MLGDCRNEELIEDLFGSVSEFACLIETHGDVFTFNGIEIRYDECADVHSFYELTGE